MHSTDKVWAIFWVSLFTAVVVVALIIAMVKINPGNLQHRQAEAQMEFQQKLDCARNKGQWVSVNDNSDKPYACSFK